MEKKVLSYGHLLDVPLSYEPGQELEHLDRVVDREVVVPELQVHPLRIVADLSRSARRAILVGIRQAVRAVQECHIVQVVALA